MKLIGKYKKVEEARQVEALLRDKGILVKLTGEHLANTPAVYLRAIVDVQLWVVLDNQYEDALLVLQNPDHEVADKLSAREMQNAEEISKRVMANAIDKSWNYFLNCLLGLITLIIIAYVVYHVL